MTRFRCGNHSLLVCKIMQCAGLALEDAKCARVITVSWEISIIIHSVTCVMCSYVPV